MLIIQFSQFNQALENKIIMIETSYTPVIKDKLNPQFIGIANKYNSSKHKRQLIQHKRNNILRTLKFKISLDIGLDKSLDQQRARLNEVRSVHQRRLADQQLKRQIQQKKRKQLRNLSTSVKQKRENNKQNLKDSLNQIFTRNRHMREQEKELSCMIQSKIKQNDERRMLNNKIKYKEVKSMERQSHEAVNNFYRTLNKESLNTYKNWITDQTKKTENYNEEIKKMESIILKYDSQIEKKKNKIINLFSQIEQYTGQTLEVQSKCLHSTLRPDLSQSSYSSKPKDLLLRTKDFFDKN